MKIFYTIAGLYRAAGMERIVTDKANYWAGAGYDVVIITTEQKGRPPAFPLASGIRHLDLEIGYEENNGASLWNKLRHYSFKQREHRRRLKLVLEREKPDVVFSMFCGDERFLYRIHDGSKKVLEVHFSHFKRLQYARKGLWALVDRWRTRQDARLVRRYDAFVTLTAEDLAYWGKPANGRIIPNFLKSMPAEPSSLESKTVLAVGRYDYQKGFERLIRAWAAIPDKGGWNLRVVGDGPLRNALQLEVKHVGVTDSVQIDTPQKDMDAVYRSASILALTSRYEGLPMVLLEAQSYGLPIVSFDCKCGPRDVVTDMSDGFLVPEGDIPLFSEKLSILMSDYNLRETMGRQARLAASRWDQENIMNQWKMLLKDIL